MKFYSIIVLIGVTFCQSGYDIAKSMSNRKSPEDIKSVLVMTLKDKKGNSLESQLISYTKDNSQKQIIWFTSPPEDRGISLYKIENKNGKDLMKMWLPAFKKIRKISSRKKSESFMNSDLTFEDLYNRSLDDFTYEIESINDSIYILTSFPKENLKSSYSKHISWMQASDLLIYKEESYGSNNTLTKTKEIKYTNINGFDLVEEIKVRDVRTKHETHLKFKDIEINSGIKDSQFHEMNLKRIPIK